MVERTGSDRSAGKHEESGRIKNIIFDLGNVLVSFKPAEYLEKNKINGVLKKEILADIFASEEWIMLDKGEIELDTAIESISTKSALDISIIDGILRKRSEILKPFTGNAQLLPELSKRGYKLYYLSNFPFDMWNHIITRDDYNFFRYFDGGIISAEVRCAKPDPEIYRLLLKKYELIPSECLFLDDLTVNISAAMKEGINGVSTEASEDIRDLVYSNLDLLNSQK